MNNVTPAFIAGLRRAKQLAKRCIALAVEVLLRTGHTMFNACILATSFARAA